MHGFFDMLGDTRCALIEFVASDMWRPYLNVIAAPMRRHRPLLLNWFRANKEISSGCVEGLNTNVKLALRKARGFKTYHLAELALHHQPGRLPEPEFTHRFC